MPFGSDTRITVLMRGAGAQMATLRNHSAAHPHGLAWGEAIRKAGLIPHLVRLATAAVEEAKKAAEAAGTLTSLAEAAALQQTTPTEKPVSLFSLYQATQALQEQAASHKPTVPDAAASAAEAAGTLAKLARAESHEGKEAAPLARGAMRPEQRQVLAAVMQPVEKPDPGRSLSFVSTPVGGDSAPAAGGGGVLSSGQGGQRLRPPSATFPLSFTRRPRRQWVASPTWRPTASPTRMPSARRARCPHWSRCSACPLGQGAGRGPGLAPGGLAWTPA